VTARLPAAERRAALLDAALHVFASEGYRATTMEAVASRAGVTKPVLYQHFSSKHELFQHLLEEVTARMRAAVVDAVAAAGSPHDQVRRGFGAYFGFVSDQPAEFRLLFGEGVRSDEDFSATVRALELDIAAVIADLIIIDGASDEARLVLAHGVVGLAEATGRHWVSDPDAGDLTTIVDLVTELAWRGLRGRPGDDDVRG